MPAAVIRRTVAVIRLRDRLARCALDRTGGDGGTYYGRMTSRRERLAHACRRDTAHRGRDTAAGSTGPVRPEPHGRMRRDVLRPYDKPPGPDGPCLPP